MSVDADVVQALAALTTGIYVLTVRDGRVVRIRQFFDRSALRAIAAAA